MIEILKEARKKLGLTQSQLAQKIGVAQNTYSRIESGQTTPDIGTAIGIAQILKVNLELIYGRNVRRAILDSVPIVNHVSVVIPVLGVIPAGIPIEAIEEVIDFEEITEELANTGNFFGLKVKGDSMSPRIMNGDVVIVKQQEDCDNGDVAVIMINGYDATLKQIKKETNGIWLVPFNQNYKPVFYGNQQIQELPIKIIGRVVELRGKF